MLDVEKPISEFDEVKYSREIKASDLTPEKKVEIIQSLPEEARWNVIADEYGFIKRPPTILEALDDPYYFGDNRGKTIYPIWRKRLQEYFPDPFHNKTLLVRLTGAIGTGKSYVSQLIIAYNLIKILHHRSYWSFNKLDKTASPASFWLFNTNLKKAEDVLVKPLKGLFNEIPFLVENWRSTGKKWGGITVEAGSRPDSALSTIIVNAILSELEFFKPTYMAKAAFDKVLSRFESRVSPSTGIFSSLIIDCQTTTESEPIVDNILKGCPYPVTSFSSTIWEAKPWDFENSTNPDFYVYCGDEMRSPFVFPDDFNLKTREDLTLDEDRIIRVPGKLKAEFISDTSLALAQKAGIRTDSSSALFPQREKLIEAFTIENKFNDVYSFDYFDKTAYWDILGELLLDVLPQDRKIYCGLDVSLVKDTTGIAFGYVDSGEQVEYSGKKIFRCKYNVPFVVGIKNKPGQSINLLGICDFLIRLKNNRSLCHVAVDQFQSAQIKQTLLEANIESDYLSVDRNQGGAYVTYKSLVMRGDVHLPKNSMLLSEHMALGRYNGKIDHPSSMPFIKFYNDGSVNFTGDSIVGDKGLSDATARAILSMSLAGTSAFDVVEREKHQAKSQLYARLAERNKIRGIHGGFGLFK